MLKLGYKASAEQFAPAKLLDFACLAEKAGFAMEGLFRKDARDPEGELRDTRIYAKTSAR